MMIPTIFFALFASTLAFPSNYHGYPVAITKRQFPDNTPLCAALCLAVKITEQEYLAPNTTPGDLQQACGVRSFTTAFDQCCRDNCDHGDVDDAIKAGEEVCKRVESDNPSPTSVLSSASAEISSVQSSVSMDIASLSSSLSKASASVSSVSSGLEASVSSIRSSASSAASAALASATSVSSLASGAEASILASASSVVSQASASANSVLASATAAAAGNGSAASTVKAEKTVILLSVVASIAFVLC